MGSLGPLEIVVILVVALLLFGAGRIADIGKGLGEGIRNFKRGLRDEDDIQTKELSRNNPKQLSDSTNSTSDPTSHARES